MIDKNNKVTEKEVLVGINNGEKIEISGENIKEGMEIVVNPNDKIKNNVIVKRIDYKEIKANRERELEKLQRENEQKKKDIEKNEAEIIRLKRNNVLKIAGYLIVLILFVFFIGKISQNEYEDEDDKKILEIEQILKNREEKNNVKTNISSQNESLETLIIMDTNSQA